VRVSFRLAAFAVGVICGLQAATEFLAWAFRWPQAFGPGGLSLFGGRLYWPWMALVWRARFAGQGAQLFQAAGLLILAGGVAGLIAGRLTSGRRAQARQRGWGTAAEARAAGLRDGGGCILGEMDGALLSTADLRPTLVTGGTRSGKGRGHVVPSLLSWPGSLLAHDPKGELWRLTAGWRSGFSHAFYFAPRDPRSARWNPLAEIRPGPAELAQVQRLVAILADPGGVRDEEAIWDKAASEILEAVVLHVLYTAKEADKTLLTVRELLADLDQTAERMVRTLHRRRPDGEAETHPFIRRAATGYAAMHDRFRTSVQGTARSYLKWLAGEDVERALSASDFTMGELMCAAAPLSLYVQVPPADAAALRPLVRLVFYAAAQSLTADEGHDAAGRPKRHQLLMAMDEFPMLGRIEFFEKSLRLMSGYGVKAMLVAQSLNDIVETYGAHNTILDNCFVYTAFSALDPLTQEKVSRLAGVTTEVRTSRSGPAGFGAGRSSVSRAEVERPLLEPGEVRGLADDEQLVFVAGRRPFRARKLRYDQRAPFRARARLAAPDQGLGVDTPGRPAHPWAGVRAQGQDPAADLPLFKEVEAAIKDKQTAAKMAEAYGRVAAELAAQEAALNHLQGLSHD
jgi:type IV secretion system protein VirD4